MRLLPLLLLLPAVAAAELDIYTVAKAVETPAPAVIDLGSGPGGDTLSVVFRLRNNAQVKQSVEYLYVAGSGFRITGQASWPFAVAPGSNYDFTVEFRRDKPGNYSANLFINSKTIVVTATATPTLALSAEGKALDSYVAVDFGTIERGGSITKTFTVSNPASEALTLSGLSVSTGAFTLNADWSAPVALAPAEQRSFTITCTPSRTGTLSGTLTAGTRVFTLAAKATEPVAPRPAIRLQTGSFSSAQQVRVAVEFAEASRGNAKGTLRVALRDGNKDDAVVFTGSGKPTIEFEVREGEKQARFGSLAEAVLQTGTVAGTLELTVELGAQSDKATIVIAPSAVRFDAATVTRNGSYLVLIVNGFDNTRTATMLSFNFYDSKGTLLTPAPIRLDAAEAFNRFFRDSTAGGLFSLKANFPVTGDATGITGVEVEITNSTGASKSQRIRF